MTSNGRRLGLAALLVGVLGVATAQDKVQLGTYLPAKGAPKLAVIPGKDGDWTGGGDICKQCLRGGPGTPNICKLLLCRRPSPDLRFEKIYVSPTAKEMFEKGCGINQLCIPDNFEVLTDWPPRPSVLNPYDRDIALDQFTRPYKGFLELSRINADQQLKAGSISRKEYNILIDAYRKDWKALSGTALN